MTTAPRHGRTPRRRGARPTLAVWPGTEYGRGGAVAAGLDRFFDPRADGHCPVCNNHSRRDGDTVDVGVGCGMQVTPDTCEVCGYVQPGWYDDYAELLGYVQKCWELQVWPW